MDSTRIRKTSGFFLRYTILRNHNSNHLWKTREVVRWSGHFQPGWCHLLISDQCLAMVSKGILKQQLSNQPLWTHRSHLSWGGRDGGNLPFSDHWKCQRGRWGGGPSFLGFNANALHEWGILQRKHTTDIVGLWMMRQISLSQMFWWLKDCGSQSSRWLGWMYTDMHRCKTCTGTHVSQPYHHINININTNINIYIKRNIIISIV